MRHVIVFRRETVVLQVSANRNTNHQAYIFQLIFDQDLLFLFVNIVLRRSIISTNIEQKSPKVKMMKAARVLSMLTGLKAVFVLQGIGTFSAICKLKLKASCFPFQDEARSLKAVF